MSIVTTLEKTKLSVYYAYAPKLTKPPYLIYMGDGQNTFEADNTYYHRENAYRVEYYFKEKSETNETAIEDVLLADGFLYSKGEDIYIEDEGVFVIYYYIGG